MTAPGPAAGPERRRVAFEVLHVTLGVVILIQSVLTVREALAGLRHGSGDPHGVLLGVPEALAAVLFLFPRTMRVGALGLLAILAVAIGVHALRGQAALPLLVYGAAVAFVFVHGSGGRAPSAG